jgi:mTERF domain-containing protein
MLKFMPIFMKYGYRLNYEFASKFTTSIRVCNSGKYKEDEMYFKSMLVKRDNNSGLKIIPDDKLGQEFSGRMPILNKRRGRIEEANDDDDDDGEEMNDDQNKQTTKRFNKTEKSKWLLEKNRELDRNMKNIYKDFVQERGEESGGGRKVKHIRVEETRMKERGDSEKEIKRDPRMHEGEDDTDREVMQRDSRWQGNGDNSYSNGYTKQKDTRMQDRDRDSYNNGRMKNKDSRMRENEDDNGQEMIHRDPRWQGREQRSYNNGKMKHRDTIMQENVDGNDQTWHGNEAKSYNNGKVKQARDPRMENQEFGAISKKYSKIEKLKKEPVPKLTPYEKEIFERNRKEAEEIARITEETRESPKDVSQTKLRQFYEYDDVTKKFQNITVGKFDDKNNSLVLANNNTTNNNNNPVNLEDSEIDNIDSIEDQIKSLRPAFRPFVYNLAYFVNESKVLQKFIEMGVEIQHWDKDREVCEFILKLDFDRDIAPYLIFLHDLGISPEGFAFIILKNPFLFKENLDNLKTRMKYLESKKFTKENISHIITKMPRWLSIPVEEIDRNLGWYQKEFQLSGAELREVIIGIPKLGVIDLKIPADMKFCFKEFLCYSNEQIKTMIKTSPKLFTKNSETIKNCYNFLIDVMKISDSCISECPQVLYMPFVQLRTRYSFLKRLKCNQFDPTKPNFVSLRDICSTDDEFFCKKIAKSSLEEFEKFLKTI